MKRFILRIGVSLITLSLGIATAFVWNTISPWSISGGRNASETLRLHLQAETTTYKVREAPDVQLTITNTGSDTVTLVLPSGWSGERTQAVGWSIIPVDERARTAATEELKFPRFGKCGNRDPRRWQEVFTLAPGETKTFQERLPWLSGPGVYRVALRYANSPRLGRSTALLVYQNPFAIWRVWHSTECSLVSNEIVVTVTE